jgi:23S rRNA (uracil1939-C5)-methyltransferase
VDRTVTCVHAERCGGCPLIGLPYEGQLARKRRSVEVEVARYADLPALAIAPVRGADPIVGYRTRAKLMVAPGARVGLYAKGGAHEVLDVPGCRVLSPALAVVAEAVRARVKRDEGTGGALGSLRAIDLREVTPPDGSAPKVLVTLVVERSPTLRLESLREAARSLAGCTPSIAGVSANFHDGALPQVLGAETVHLSGERAAFGAFTQAHRGQAEAIQAIVAGAVRGKRILDVYGGSGAFALGLAARGAEIVLVESFAPAAAEAEAEAARRGLSVKAVAKDATAALESLARRHLSFDSIVVNPPRRGVPPDARRALARLGAEVIAYVSCDPGTLARDLDHLATLGYRASELLPFDMIPLTDHVETVAVLRRAEPSAPRVLYEDDDVIAVAKHAHEPTTPQGEHGSSLTDRVRRHLASDAVPIHRLDVGTSGVVLFARTPSRVAPWSKALGASSAHKVYLAAVRGAAPEKGIVEKPIKDGKRQLAATTRFERVGILGEHSLLEVSPEQGRTHQIRIHLASFGHPVLGDARYGHAATNRHFEEKHGLDRTLLHCKRIELVHPKTGARLVVDAPLAGDLEAVLGRMNREFKLSAPPPR